MSSISLTPLTIQRNVYLNSSLLLMEQAHSKMLTALKYSKVLHFAYEDEGIKLMTHGKLKLKKMCLLCHLGFDLNP